jgi:hypothetical protein
MAANIKLPDELPIYDDLDQCDVTFLVCGTVILAAIALWALHQFWTRRKVERLWI